jgi:hypothetical protein
MGDSASIRRTRYRRAGCTQPCPSGSGGGGWIPLVTRGWPPTSFYRPTYRYLRGDADKQALARQDLAALKKADAGELTLLSQDEARFPMVPTLGATLGVKGRRSAPATARTCCMSSASST